tara:strand:- start:286 stop:789 length:504 start_codon:yes stop_codon:yes gene_type:complete
MIKIKIDKEINLSNNQILKYFDNAQNLERKRFPLALHKKGAKKNKLLNFLIKDTYIRPHSHNSLEKKEQVKILYGHIKLIIFDEAGNIVDSKDLKLSNKKNRFLTIPPFTIHTYLLKSDKAIIYEKMDGKYDINSKTYPNWAPPESTKQSILFMKKIEKLTISPVRP